MSFQTDDLLDLERILDQGNLKHFLEETARFYDSRLLVLDSDLEVIAALNHNGSEPDPDSVPIEREGANWSAKSPRVNSVTVYGVAVGLVCAEAVSTPEEQAAAAFSRYAADLLSELAEKEYELNDLSQEILDSYEEVNLFYEVSSALGAARDVESICNVILQKACEIIRVHRASILLFDPKAGVLRVAAAVGIPDEEQESIQVQVGQGISGKVFESRTPQLVDDIHNLPRGLLKGYEEYATSSFMSVPLCLGRRPEQPGLLRLSERTWVPDQGDRAIGVINMTDKEDRQNFTSGDLKLLSALGSQAAVLIENIRLIELEKEMRIARTIQEGLLPAEPPRIRGLDVAGVCVPAQNVGGDYFDYVTREGDDRIAVAVADVSGHNMASALMMAVARSAIRGEIRRSADPGAVLGELNGFLYEDLTRAELFLSVFLVVIDPANRRIEFTNAGHNPALLLKKGEKHCALLDADGLLTGVLPESEYPVEERSLEPGDIILVYTDGIVEASDAAGTLFGIERLAASLEKHRSLPSKVLLSRILEAVAAFSGGNVQNDDMTAVALKVTEEWIR